MGRFLTPIRNLRQVSTPSPKPQEGAGVRSACHPDLTASQRAQPSESLTALPINLDCKKKEQAITYHLKKRRKRNRKL